MVEVAAAPDEDEKYLYGEHLNSDAVNNKGGVVSGDAASASLPVTSAAASTTEDVKKQDEEDEDGEFEESDDDDEDNIQVHIGEVNASTATGPYGPGVAWKKDGASGATAVAKVAAAALPTQGAKKIDVNAVGLINGQPIYEYDIESEQDEKPWRKPGADISDYFNYGFIEDTWKQYCEKQRRMRMESQRGSYTVTQTVNQAAPQNVEIEVLPDGRTRVKAGPPPDRKVEGSIHVLGFNDARRKQKEEELLALALGGRVVGPPGFPGQRPMYTALPGGAVMFNQLPGQPLPTQMMAPPQQPTSQQSAEMGGQPPPSQAASSQGAQQIQSLGGGPIMTTVGLPAGLQYMGPGGPNIPGLQQLIPTQVFPPGAGMGMEFQQQDQFIHPHGAMLPPMSSNFGQFQPQSDSDFDSDGENRRQRSSRRESKHRRHRDRSDRDRSDRDKDRETKTERDRSSSVRRDRDRSDARRTRDHSKQPSDRKSKSHSSRSSSSARPPEEESERKPRVSRRAKKEPELMITSEEAGESVKKELPEVKQEPTGE